MSHFQLTAGGHLHGRLQVPGDKSISHRSLMFAALARGDSHINGFLPGLDCRATQHALRDMGVQINELSATEMIVSGVGMHGLRAAQHPLDMGNSGTSMRLFMGLLAGQTFQSQLIGDESLSRRPMQRVADPLMKMGAVIATHEGRAPITISPSKTLRGIDFQMPVASAQLKSALLLAGMYAQGETVIHEDVISRDHTERMLQQFSYPITQQRGTTSITGGHTLQACSINVPGDFSSACFFIVAACISPGADLLIENVGINPTRTGALNILKEMGARIDLRNQRMSSNEPIADIHVEYAPLHGVEVAASDIVSAIDEFPALMIAFACAQGTSIVRNASELRVKETDRIAAMAEGLTRLGISVDTFADGAIVHGGVLQSGALDSHGDHRIAMAFAISALRAQGTIDIADCANVATSFPNFVKCAQTVGLRINEINP